MNKRISIISEKMMNKMPLFFFYLHMLIKERTINVLSTILIVFNIALSVLGIVFTNVSQDNFEYIVIFKYFFELIIVAIIVIISSIGCFNRHNHMLEEEKRFGYAKDKSFLEKCLAIIIFVYGNVLILLLIDAIIGACFIGIDSFVRFGYNINFDVFLLLFALIIMVIAVAFIVYFKMVVALILIVIFSLIAILSPILNNAIDAISAPTNDIAQEDELSKQDFENFYYTVHLSNSLYRYAINHNYQGLFDEYNSLLNDFSNNMDDLQQGDILKAMKTNSYHDLPLIANVYHSVDDAFNKQALLSKYYDATKVLDVNADGNEDNLYLMLSYFANNFDDHQWNGYFKNLAVCYHDANRNLNFRVPNWYESDLWKTYKSPLELLVLDVFVDSLDRMMHLNNESTSAIQKRIWLKDKWYHDDLLNFYANPFYQMVYLSSSGNYYNYFDDYFRNENNFIMKQRWNYLIDVDYSYETVTENFTHTIDGKSDFCSRVVLSNQRRIVNYGVLYAIYYVCFAGLLFACLPVYRKR